MEKKAKLTAEQEAKAQELAPLLREAMAADILEMARLLVSKDERHTFGLTELQLRDLLHQAGVKALQTALAQKKTAIKDLA
jgi:hypothetical protein